MKARRSSSMLMTNSPSFLNVIAMKYRYEQMKMNQIFQKIKKKEKNKKKNDLFAKFRFSLLNNGEEESNDSGERQQNLFERLQHRGSVFDIDILRSQKILSKIKEKRILEGKDNFDLSSSNSDSERKLSLVSQEKINQIIEENIPKNNDTKEMEEKTSEITNSFDEFFENVNEPESEIIVKESTERKTIKSVPKPTKFEKRKKNKKIHFFHSLKDKINSSAKQKEKKYSKDFLENNNFTIINENSKKMLTNIRKETNKLDKNNDSFGISNTSLTNKRDNQNPLKKNISNIVSPTKPHFRSFPLKLNKKPYRVGDLIQFYQPLSEEAIQKNKRKEKSIKFPVLNKKKFQIFPQFCKNNSFDVINQMNQTNQASLTKLRTIDKRNKKKYYDNLSYRMDDIRKKVDTIIQKSEKKFFSKVNRVMKCNI